MYTARLMFPFFALPGSPLRGDASGRPDAQAQTQQTLSEPASFVSNEGTEQCCLCGCDTGIPFETPIDLRVGYIEGGGQLCQDCRSTV